MARLNISTLRNFSFNKNEKNSAKKILLTEDDSVEYSRRQMIGMSGVALVTAYPLFKRFSAILANDFKITSSKNRVALLLKGRERFVVDAKYFSGKPEVILKNNNSQILIILKNAFYPGTKLSADFSAIIKPGIFGRTISIKMLIGGFKAEGNLENWLLGYSPLNGAMELNNVFCELKKGVGLLSKGFAQAEFNSDWGMSIIGNNIGMIAGLGSDIFTNNIDVSILSKESKSFVNNPSNKRTLISIKRGENLWGIVPVVTDDDNKWNFQANNETFAFIDIESGESKIGNQYHVVIAHSKDNNSTLNVVPHSALIGGFGAAFNLPLNKPRYAITFDEEGDKRVLIAEYGRESKWLHADNLSVFLGNYPEANYNSNDNDKTDDVIDSSAIPKNNFEIKSVNGKLDSVYCAPALKGTFVPVQDSTVISEPTLTQNEQKLLFSDGYTKKWKKSRSKNNVIVINDELQAGDDKLVSSIFLTMNPRISLIRPEDLVALDFEFDNFTVSNGFAKRGSGRAYMIVHFQPQNIAEEAFWETDPNLISKDKNGNTIPNNNGNETLTGPPVKSRISGPSRIVFRVPSSLANIELNLENLLKLCSTLEMNTASTAKPKYDWKILSTLVSTGVIFSQRILDKSDKEKENEFSTVKVGSESIGTKAIGDVNLDGSKGVRSKLFQYRSEMMQTPKNVISSGTVSNKFGTGKQFNSDSGIDLSKINSEKFKYKVFDDWGDSSENETPIPYKPTGTETAIEAPYRLIISPSRQSGWAHAPLPVASKSGGKIELWHTRLGRRFYNDESKTYYTSEEYDEIIRAIWSPDYDFSINKNHYNSNNKGLTPGTPFRMSLDDLDRCNIVELTSNYRIAKLAKLKEPAPVNVKSLMLSSLGAWLDFKGDWNLDKYVDAQPKLSVQQWQHRGTMGRDHYVKVVYAGYLFPFGHKASLVKVTERKFHNDVPGNVAYLRQRMFLIVREKVRTYNAEVTRVHEESGNVRADFEMPLKRVEIMTAVTPNLDKPEGHDINSFSQSGFWPYVAGKPFIFQINAEDIGGTVVELNMPLVFVENNINADSSKLNKIVEEYNKDDNSTKALVEVSTGGKTIMFAPSAKTGDTSFETQKIRFAGYSVSRRDNFSNFHPIVKRTAIIVPAMKGITGNTTPINVGFEKIFAQSGFDGSSNKGEVFLKALSKNVLNFSDVGDRAGAFAKPNIDVKGLSRVMGPIGSKNGDLSSIAGGNFDPKSHFAGLMDSFSPKLFGVFDLWDILSAVGLDVREAVPKLLGGMTENVEGMVNNFKTLFEIAQFVLDLATNDPMGKGGDPINEGYSKAAEVFKKAFDAASTQFTSVINGLVNKLKDQIQAVLNKQINNLISSAKQKFENEVSSLSNTIQNSIKSKTDPIKNSLISIENSINSIISDVQTISGTSNFESLDLIPMINHVNGLSGNILGLIGSVNSVGEIPSSARNLIITPLSTIENVIGDVESILKYASDVVNSFKIKPQIEKVKDDVNSVYSDVQSLFNEIKTKVQQPNSEFTDFLNFNLNPLKNHLGDLKTDLNGLCNKIDAIFIIPGPVRQGIIKPISDIEVLIGGATTGIQTVQQVVDNLKGIIKAFGCIKSIFNDTKKIIDEFTAIFSSGDPLTHSFDPLENALNALSTHIKELGSDINLITLIPSPQRNSISNALGEVANIVDKVETVIDWLDKLRDFIDGLRNGGEIRISLEWKPELKSFPSSKPIFIASNKSKKATFTIGVYMKAKLTGGSAPEINGSASLQNFTIAILPQLATLIELHFNKIEFKMGTSGKPDIVCDFDEIKFVGPLSFIETLKNLIPLDGFSDPPALDVSLEGIKASFSIALPNVAVGVFSLTNMALGAFLNVPFIGPPLSFGFNFCTRENPFCMTVWIIGGGGFFGIVLTPKGMQKIEMALEAGAKVGLDFGVASGSVEIMLGIYFSLERIVQKIDGKDEEVTKTTLEGYLRICGRLSVLGLIKATITLKLSMTYEFESGKLIGRAELEIEVEVFFFSFSVTLSYERKFAGSNGDPSFKELMAPYSFTDASNGESINVKPWEEYCMSFA